MNNIMHHIKNNKAEVLAGVIGLLAMIGSLGTLFYMAYGIVGK